MPVQNVLYSQPIKYCYVSNFWDSYDKIQTFFILWQYCVKIFYIDRASKFLSQNFENGKYYENKVITDIFIIMNENISIENEKDKKPTAL